KCSVWLVYRNERCYETFLQGRAVQQLLYVDDDEAIREVAALSLGLDGRFEVTLAASGRQAVDLLGRGLRPDAALIDVMMPDLDGPQTLACIRAQGFTQLSVIFITARSLDDERAALMALGARGIITKPFDPLRLADEVTQILARDTAT
ncbi:MAG: response regulator, partial [Alphaproteobacteria bacterium]|nr:response regulator [Alphaproteobacteria bacterium]